MNSVHTYVMTKRLQSIGNSAGIIVDKPILELLGITAETDLELTTDWRSLIITPRRSTDARARKLAKVQEKTLKNHEGTFRKLAK
jgi:antitoxin MazE